MKPRRPRRVVSEQRLALLQLFGWRYSNSRGAWVHRLGRGKHGPVFLPPSAYGVRELSDGEASLLESMLEPNGSRADPGPHRIHLPKRAAPAATEPMVPAVRVPVRVTWQHGDEERVVYVDGRPPTAGAPTRSSPDAS